jgi:hypothetical protein
VVKLDYISVLQEDGGFLNKLIAKLNPGGWWLSSTIVMFDNVKLTQKSSQT